MPTPARDTLTKALKALQDNPENPEAVIAGFEEQAADLRSQAAGLEQMANGIRVLMGQPVPDPTAPVIPAPSPRPVTGRPEGMEAVRQIMSDGEVWSVAEIFEEMKRRGWESKESKNPIRPTEAAVNRLWKVKREIERVGRAKYRYINASPASDRTGSGDLSFLNGASSP